MNIQYFLMAWSAFWALYALTVFCLIRDRNRMESIYKKYIEYLEGQQK